MGDEHHRLIEFALQTEELGLELRTHDRVDGSERLVHEQDVGVRGETPSDADALLLAAGELARVTIGQRSVETNRVEQAEGILPRPFPGYPVEHRNGGDIVNHREVRQQAGVLHDIADAPPQGDGLEPGGVFPVDLDRSGGQIDHTVDHAQQGGFARSGRPDQDRRLARGEHQAEVFDGHRAVGKLFFYAAELDHGTAHSSWETRIDTCRTLLPGSYYQLPKITNS